MPSVLCYHSRILVAGPRGMVVIESDHDDFVSDGEVLGGLGRKYGVGTVGEVVEAAKLDGGVRVKRGDGLGGVVFEWGDPV